MGGGEREREIHIKIHFMLKVLFFNTIFRQKSQTTLSSIQKDVLNELTQIFSNYDMAVIGTSVCHPSNLVEPLTKQSLLQRCIDDLLDARTAHEAATGTYFKPRNDLKNSADGRLISIIYNMVNIVEPILVYAANIGMILICRQF